MGQSWKLRAAAAAVSMCLMTLCEYAFVHNSYNRTRDAYLARQAKFYDEHSNGKGFGLAVFSSVITAIGAVCLAIVPYEITLKAIDSRRLRGED